MFLDVGVDQQVASLVGKSRDHGFKIGPRQVGEFSVS